MKNSIQLNIFKVEKVRSMGDGGRGTSPLPLLTADGERKGAAEIMQ